MLKEDTSPPPSVERLVDLALLPDTCLLAGRVFPSVRYCLAKGDEGLFASELNDLMEVLRPIQGVGFFLTEFSAFQ